MRLKILEVGRKEFLRCGFQKASIRDIAKQAGVTTGSIYCYFSNKQAIFETLVKESADHIIKAAREKVIEMDTMMRQDSSRYLTWVQDEPEGFLDYIYEHYDAFHLLFSCSEGTIYENLFDEIIDIETESTIIYANHLRNAGIINREIDEELVHIVASAYYTGFIEPIIHGMSKEKAVKYIKTLAEFYSAGWKKIFGL
ncbi:MAG: TetR/AcrR family transcriptional regulator [Suipraeoptans sp.]